MIIIPLTDHLITVYGTILYNYFSEGLCIIFFLHKQTSEVSCQYSKSHSLHRILEIKRLKILLLFVFITFWP